MKITGILSISNATGLNYPFNAVVKNLSEMCDDVIVGVDPNFGADEDLVHMANPDARIVRAPWDRTNRKGGSEIAIQMERLVEAAGSSGSDWVVVLQADELLHEDTFADLRLALRSAPPGTTGFSMDRLYFWENLNIMRDDWRARLVRVFRPGAYSFLAENTDKAGMFSGQSYPGLEIPLDAPHFIYHYSRVEAGSVISRRVRNLDSFFHEEDNLISIADLPDYDFQTRQYDNYSKVEKPPEVKGRFSSFLGTHPRNILEYLGQND